MEKIGNGSKRPPRPLPPAKLADILRLATTIAESNAGRPMDRLLLADAFGIKPGSSLYRDLLKSSSQYGVTKGSEKSDQVALTDLGTRYSKPAQVGERENALLEIIQKPDLAAKVYAHYNRSKWQDAKFLRNVLERQFGVAPEWSEWVAITLEENAKAAGVLKSISGSSMLMLSPSGKGPALMLPEATGASSESPSLEEDSEPDDESPLEPPATKKQKAAIFVGHGRNSGPLKQLKEILDQFKIPYKIAVYEPNRGLPISQKVRQLMDECSSAILLFTKDECLFDKDQKEVWRPSENVVHELGAASALYGGRIIIFKENGLELPSNFRDIGYIPFDGAELKAKAVELLQELIAFGLVAIQPAQ